MPSRLRLRSGPAGSPLRRSLRQRTRRLPPAWLQEETPDSTQQGTPEETGTSAETENSCAGNIRVDDQADACALIHNLWERLIHHRLPRKLPGGVIYLTWDPELATEKFDHFMYNQIFRTPPKSSDVAIGTLERLFANLSDEPGRPVVYMKVSSFDTLFSRVETINMLICLCRWIEFGTLNVALMSRCMSPASDQSLSPFCLLPYRKDGNCMNHWVAAELMDLQPREFKTVADENNIFDRFHDCLRQLEDCPRAECPAFAAPGVGGVAFSVERLADFLKTFKIFRPLIRQFGNTKHSKIISFFLVNCLVGHGENERGT
eukprot:Gregarina_sp_Poly_1__172@NODE_103_length_14370_cov_80_074250_g90_i0_p5_GENE_NODE_103_length_14370_cov_80_074250_g90_i0NODE_103_length_14370_cov_80_074250_g90_i0_p5_ORF_typecomplete_len318_score40_27_NODE_103_length_14370_cov_80_074250_g90_i02651218